MTYKDQFVVEVKCKNKILRIKEDFVYLPFGSEYSLYFKNLSSKRASIKVSIDGEDVLDNQSLILDANSSTELEGFLRGNQARNRFRFIHKTKEIQEHRGDRIDDGFIRVEFAYEKPKPKVSNQINYYFTNNKSYQGNPTFERFTYSSNQPVSRSSVDLISASNVTCDSLGVQNQSQPLDDEGITVKGSEMRQDYTYTTIGELENSEVIIIRLKGISEKSQLPIQQALTVSSKIECSSCGKKSKSSFKYCPNCGTYLE